MINASSVDLRRMALAGVVASLLVVPFAGVAAPLSVVSPREGAVVPTLSDGQKAYLQMPRKERVKYFADSGRRREMVKLGYYPKPVRLEWKGGAPGAEYTVKVVRRPDGKQFFSYTGTNTYVDVDNLEIARTYGWTVSGGGELSATFSTEATAPRLMRVPGVPNVRDLGGRIGLGGRRVRQGLVFRSAGLNDNARSVYFTREELEKAGRITPEMLEKEKKIKAHIAKYRRYQADPKTFPRSHRGWRSWSKRHPGASQADYFARRIKGDNEDLAELFKVGKRRVPGKNRLDDATRSYLVDTLGIRSDIDLRSDRECYGMTGSPMGPRAKWFHYSSSAYGGMQEDGGKAAFKKVFAVFLDERNYPLDFHCIAGQDRTGAVAFILNGLLGVAEEELYLDWEVTGFWNPRTSFSHARRFDKLVDGFMKKVPGATLHEKIENYVLSLGFTKADIEKFRSIMLE
jgi:hypothetical protein